MRVFTPTARTPRTLLLLFATFLPSVVRIMIWRVLGFRVGTGCYISPFSVIAADYIEFESGVRVDPFCLIYAPRQLTMGERCRVASFVRILGYGSCAFGAQTLIGMSSLINIDTSTEFRLGRHSGLGPRSTYFTHGGNHGLTCTKRYRLRIGPIIIGQDSWVGMACTVYPDVVIGDGTVAVFGPARTLWCVR